MSAQDSLLETKLPEFDLLDRRSWKPSVDEQGRPVPRVIMSLCGRYTIVQLTGYGEHTDGCLVRISNSYQAFRRHGRPEHPRWDPPTWCEVFPSPEDARRGCAEHRSRELGK